MVRVRPDSGPAARGAGRTAARPWSEEFESCLRRRQPGLAAPSSQLGCGAQSYSEAAASREGQLCAPCLASPARGRPAPTLRCRSPARGRFPRNSAGRTQPRPLPALEAGQARVARRLSRAGLRRQEAGQSRPPHPPAPSAGPPASHFRGPRPSASPR